MPCQRKNRRGFAGSRRPIEEQMGKSLESISALKKNGLGAQEYICFNKLINWPNTLSMIHQCQTMSASLLVVRMSSCPETSLRVSGRYFSTLNNYRGQPRIQKKKSSNNKPRKCITSAYWQVGLAKFFPFLFTRKGNIVGSGMLLIDLHLINVRHFQSNCSTKLIERKLLVDGKSARSWRGVVAAGQFA